MTPLLALLIGCGPDACTASYGGTATVVTSVHLLDGSPSRDATAEEHEVVDIIGTENGRVIEFVEPGGSSPCTEVTLDESTDPNDHAFTLPKGLTCSFDTPLGPATATLVDSSGDAPAADVLELETSFTLQGLVPRASGAGSMFEGTMDRSFRGRLR